MNDAFENLGREKQDLIINAALIEFAENGYKRASTNNIVKAAGIGKGMLFYYFKNKQELYNFLIDYAVTCCESFISRAFNLKEDDIIERYKLLNDIKMEGYYKYPKVYDFLGRLYIEMGKIQMADETRKRIEKMLQIRQQALSNAYSDVNTSLFRQDLSPDKIIKYIRWSMDGYTQDVIDRLKDINLSGIDYTPYLAEYKAYLEDLKKLFYKQS